MAGACGQIRRKEGIILSIFGKGIIYLFDVANGQKVSANGSLFHKKEKQREKALAL